MESIIFNVNEINKVYNASTLGTSTYTINGIYSGDVVDISNIYLTNFADRFAGNNKPVYISQVNLIGTDYFNYVIDVSSSRYTSVASITSSNGSWFHSLAGREFAISAA